ncbi:hypothetical protein [Streptomyces axinellae]|uniref:Uncharacterized protein n=1 Tax=Streptomyces axinellae TaxID=552788 RepID=A0ABP6CEJ2_9ACTN
MAPNSDQQNSSSQPPQGSAAADQQPDTYNFADSVRSSGVLQPQRPSVDASAPSQADQRAMRQGVGVPDGTGPGYHLADLIRTMLPSAQPDGNENAASRTSGTGSGYRFADLVRENLPRIQNEATQNETTSRAASRTEPGRATAGKKYEAPGHQAKKARRP